MPVYSGISQEDLLKIRFFFNGFHRIFVDDLMGGLFPNFFAQLNYYGFRKGEGLSKAPRLVFIFPGFTVMFLAMSSP